MRKTSRIRTERQERERAPHSRSQGPIRAEPQKEDRTYCLSLRLSRAQYRQLRWFVRSIENHTRQSRQQQAVLQLAVEAYLDRNANSNIEQDFETINGLQKPQSKSDPFHSHIVPLRLAGKSYRHLRQFVLDVEEQTGRRLTHQSILERALTEYLDVNSKRAS